VDAGREVFLPGAYWKFLGRILRNYITNPTKLWMGTMILLAGHHFLIYAHEVAQELARAIGSGDVEPAGVPIISSVATV
jgi:hypothetical protein